MPPQNNQQPPVPPQPDQPVPQSPEPQPYPEQQTSGIPPLHPTHIQQDFPAAAAPKEPENRYAFFMEAKPKPKKTLLPSKGNKFGWVLIVGIATLVIIAVMAIAISASRSGQDKSDTDSLLGLVSQQQEIIRVTGLAEKTLQSPQLSNFNVTANLSASSSQLELISYSSKKGGKIDVKALKKRVGDASTDTALQSALAASVYDSTYKRIMTEIIAEYQSRLARLASASTVSSDKEILEKNLAAAELLYIMLTEQQ